MSLPARTTIEIDEDSHLRGVTKLKAIAFLLSQAHLELEVESEVFHGLSWLIDDAVDQVSEHTSEGGAR